MSSPASPLPILEALPRIRAALAAARAAVVVAEPGAGKSTVVPLELLDEPWLGGKRIVMLEPRRVAARFAARRMAQTRGEAVGDTVGYRVRFDTRVSSSTRIEVVTEGVLTRLLRQDPALEEYGLVIFDEFHERSLPADLGLALTLESRAVLRPDLGVLVMSATIDSAATAALLGDVPVVESPGRVHPVTTHYRPRRPDQPLESHLLGVIDEALDATDGDLLVFLPGAGEIRRVGEALAARRPDLAALPLHGSLPAEEQDRALTPGPRRRVVLSTSIAETSLTLEGIRAVIDAGLMRIPRFSPRTGMTRLETVTVTRASADQRRGRAGRLGPGACYRCWHQSEDHGLREFNTPEILAADLASLALDLALAGVREPESLRWLDPPPSGAWRQATALLRDLDALDERGVPTPHGKRLGDLALHPRLAHLAVGALDRGSGGLAAALVTLLGDRDVARRGPGPPPECDLRLRVDAIRSGAGSTLELDRGAVARARRTAREWRDRLRVPHAAPVDADETGALLALAYPDRIAARREGRVGSFLLRNGRGVSVGPADPLSRADYLVVAELDDRGSEPRVLLAASIALDTITTLFADRIEETELVSWDAARSAVTATARVSLGALTLGERRIDAPDPERVRAVLLEEIRRVGVDGLPWSDRAWSLRRRLGFAATLEPDRFPAVDAAALDATLEEWLGPHLTGVRTWRELEELDLGGILSFRIEPRRRRLLDDLAPAEWVSPVGRSHRIDYSDPAAPAVEVKLQELFGVERTPSVGNGRVPLTLRLLSPANRPVQVTRDLAGFWRSSYFDVRRDLRGRYPKHQWPEDPLAAEPTRGPRRRG
ncbi:MAG: ATP-dependent helicase HrpB [Gemmatimonadales bacterium]